MFYRYRIIDTPVLVATLSPLCLDKTDAQRGCAGGSGVRGGCSDARGDKHVPDGSRAGVEPHRAKWFKTRPDLQDLCPYPILPRLKMSRLYWNTLKYSLSRDGGRPIVSPAGAYRNSPLFPLFIQIQLSYSFHSDLYCLFSGLFYYDAGGGLPSIFCFAY